MISWRIDETVISSRHGRDRVPASLTSKGAGARQERRVEANEMERNADNPANAILLPMAVAAVFLAALVLGAIVG